MTQGVAVRESGITGLITQFAGMKDVVQLHGGLPPPAAFPISGVSLRLADGGSIDISDPDLVGRNILKSDLTSSDLGREQRDQPRHQRGMTLGVGGKAAAGATCPGAAAVRMQLSLITAKLCNRPDARTMSSTTATHCSVTRLCCRRRCPQRSSTTSRRRGTPPCSVGRRTTSGRCTRRRRRTMCSSPRAQTTPSM